MGLDEVFEDGPYEGEQLEDVIEDHPFYIEQLVDDNYPFDDEVYELLTKKGIL